MVDSWELAFFDGDSFGTPNISLTQYSDTLPRRQRRGRRSAATRHRFTIASDTSFGRRLPILAATVPESPQAVRSGNIVNHVTINTRREMMALTPAQDSLLEHWLKERNDHVHPQPLNLSGGRRAEIQVLVPLTPTQDSLLEHWLKKPVVLPMPKTRHQKSQNLKWTDDVWFEERYGDPHYYTRIKGLS